MINDIRDNLFMQRCTLTILRKFRHRFIEFAKDFDAECTFKSSLLENDGACILSIILFARTLITLFCRMHA